MIPWLELSKLIAQRGYQIFFISTPRNIDRLPKLSPELASSIHFVKLPMPHVDNLPENVEATTDISYEQVWYLKQAFDSLQQPMKELLQSVAPNWVFTDFAFWLPDLARQLRIRSGFFSIFTRRFLDYTRIPKWIRFPTTVAICLFEARKIFHLIKGDGSNVSDLYRFGHAIQNCDVIAVRSCMDFEPEWLNLLAELHPKPVVPVGQLPTTDNDAEEETETQWANTKLKLYTNTIKEWLDKQEKGSVVYIAFGSEAKPSQKELNEIALGLELSGLPFFWVLKKRLGPADSDLIELPDGFEERTKGRGIVCTFWAPQLKILAHGSVGGFLTHSGWSSVVEALQFGRALIILTFYADQCINAKVLEEKKVGYLIPRNEVDGSFTSNAVAESLKLVLVDEEGKIYRDKAKEMRGLFGDRDRQDR
ncbi:hypothetical protein ACOSP7_023488 [Xanthoceras sorbifolium]